MSNPQSLPSALTNDEHVSIRRPVGVCRYLEETAGLVSNLIGLQFGYSVFEFTAFRGIYLGRTYQRLPKKRHFADKRGFLHNSPSLAVWLIPTVFDQPPEPFARLNPPVVYGRRR